MNSKIRVIFLILLGYLLYSQDLSKSPVINKIVYRKEVIDFNQPVIINIYLNPMKIIDISVFLNDEEINNLNKNIKPYDNNYEDFYPHINFEINKANEENTLRIFVTLSQGLVVSAIEKIRFHKVRVIDSDNRLKGEKYFYLKLGEIKESAIYDTLFDKKIIKRIDDVLYNNHIYTRFEIINKGRSLIQIYEFNNSDFTATTLPIKPIKEINIIIE